VRTSSRKGRAPDRGPGPDGRGRRPRCENPAPAPNRATTLPPASPRVRWPAGSSCGCRPAHGLEDPGELDRAPEEASQLERCLFNGGRLGGLEAVEQPDLHLDAAPLRSPKPGAAHAAPDGDDVGEAAAER